MVFRWRADDGPTLNSGLVALWFSRGSEPVLLRKVRKATKIRNQYNQVPHLTQATTRASDKKQQKLEDLTVLMRSPDLLNNVKIGQDQLQLITLFYGGCGHLIK